MYVATIGRTDVHNRDVKYSKLMSSNLKLLDKFRAISEIILRDIRNVKRLV